MQGGEEKVEEAKARSVSNAGGAVANWDALGIHPVLLENLKRYGIAAPTTIQRMVIPALIKGRSLSFSSETGPSSPLLSLPSLLTADHAHRHWQDIGLSTTSDTANP